MTSSQLKELHFIFIPLLSPGHVMPMVDIARLFAQHGITVTIISTPLNTARFKTIVDRAVVESGLRIQIVDLDFPAAEAGLPEGCQNMDSISRDMITNFFTASRMLQQPLEDILENLSPRPSCIISGKNLAWTVETALKFKIPRLFFDGTGCFSFACANHLQNSEEFWRVSSKTEPVLVPGLAHDIVLTKAQLPEALNPHGSGDLHAVREKMVNAESIADGIIVNSFEELEPDYVKDYKRVKGGNVWCIGPVSACNKLNIDKAERGNLDCAKGTHCLEWLDSQEPNSTIHACLGSISGLTASQLVELALGLEASKRPFIWVIRSGKRSEELEKWIEEENFEARTKGRGLLIRGWAPQLLILAHSSIGGFLTHCGWNSTIEGLSAGKPIITCPLFAEQFINEKLVVEVLGTGVSVGVEAAVAWGLEDKSGLVMKRENVKKAIEKVLDKGKEGEERRERAREIGEMARMAIEEGGSSYFNMKSLIQYVMEQNELNHGCT